jgi:uncharacterized membrane protein
MGSSCAPISRNPSCVSSSPVPADTKTRRFFRNLLGVVLVLQGINHFVVDEEMARWIPSWLPEPLLLVHLSGIAEIVLGLALFVPRLRRWAGWGIVALLIAVFPANIEMARRPELLPNVPEILFWLRLPLQLVFAWWVWACAVAPARERS